MMNDSTAYGYQEGSSPPSAPPRGPGQYSAAAPGTPMQSHKFSQDELRVLGECNRESFYQRCLPIGTALGITAYAAVQTGHLKPNPRFGSFPKVTLAVVVGYFLGKLSYQQVCAEKLMALPDSYIGQLLRDRRERKFGGTGGSKSAASMFGAGPGDIYSDAGMGSSLNLDTDRPLFNDDAYRPNDEGAKKGPQDGAPQRPVLSYEEMRRRNRGEYTDAKQDPYRMDPNAMPPISRARPSPPPRAPTNKYGDDME